MLIVFLLMFTPSDYFYQSFFMYLVRSRCGWSWLSPPSKNSLACYCKQSLTLTLSCPTLSTLCYSFTQTSEVGNSIYISRPLLKTSICPVSINMSQVALNKAWHFSISLCFLFVLSAIHANQSGRLLAVFLFPFFV